MRADRVARREVLRGAAACLGAGTVAIPSAFGQDGPSQAQRWRIPSDDALRALLADRIDRQRRGVGIVVGVLEPSGRRVVAYGASGAGRALDGETLFQIGSVTKIFTTLLMADMVVRNEAALDDPAQAYLPSSVRLRERGRPITLRDLATHVSGLPAMPVNLALRRPPNPIAAYTAEDLYAFLSSYDPPREPGAAFAYSNLGVSLLGRLLARRAGMDYEPFLRARVLAPLRLDDTAITLGRKQRERLTPGHDRYLNAVETWEMRAMPASGSLRSTCNDLLRFIGAYLDADTPLKRAAALQLAQPRPPVGPSQALGLFVRRADGFVSYGINGGKAGYRSFFAFNPEVRTGAVVLSNTCSDDTLDALGFHILCGRQLSNTAPAAAAPSFPEARRLPRRLRQRYEGRYQVEDAVYVVGCTAGRLYLQTWGEGVEEFFAAGGHVFFSRVSDAQLVFEGADADAATGFVLSGREQRRAIRVS